MRENLKLINSVLEEADIWLDITDEQMLELRKEISQKRDRNLRDVDFNRKTLHRVFLDRRLDLGGRFYGPWYQNIPKKYREYIRSMMLQHWNWIIQPCIRTSSMPCGIWTHPIQILTGWMVTPRKPGNS